MRCVLRTAAALVFLTGLLVPVAIAQRPDFTGVWGTYRGGGGRGGGGRSSGTGALRPEAQAKVDAYQALVSATGDTPGGFCLGTGMPGSMAGSGGYPMEIIQRPDQITIIYEAHNEIRRVYFGERVIPPADRLAERDGYSVGHWEGDTLVVEVTQLKEQVDQRYPHSADATIVERYTMDTDDSGTPVLTNEWTMTDPAFYTSPVTGLKQWSRIPNGFLMTYECTEPMWTEHLDELARRAN
jgi:hypothetical protein